MALRRLLGIVIAAVVAAGLLLVSAPVDAGVTASCSFGYVGRQGALSCNLTGAASPANSIWSVNGSHLSQFDGATFAWTSCAEVGGQWTVQVSYTDTNGAAATGYSAGNCHTSSAQSCHTSLYGKVLTVDCVLAGAASPPGSTWVINGSYQSADDNLTEVYPACVAGAWSSQVSYIDASGFATTNTVNGTC